ncbi:nucleoside triphosphate pyrophosphohydrolase [Luteibacter flocculans]|uniref:Nucleoside triphosphate pyrophosphohydrolase n=1 Tax=Luteibacter flocculans TaxID=2780091 RepID=A0ABY4T3D3_9GAMM|nr:nucleoside triphosphate pyrophosphohydrolase [Luteibacter flocculans]URL59180.1 nucleoside triphosphate pyrophosphohydrolase [Luteibacter flocculans]
MTRTVDELIAIMARLRDPENGCPWDVRQDFASIAPYTIEEAYEVVDAIDRGDMHDLRDELGDLLLQVIFHSRMAEEHGQFAFEDVVASICDKMVRRHPHVFGDTAHENDSARSRDWDRLKAEERAAKGSSDTSALAGISRGLPEWQRAVKLQKRAANVGFDWPDYRPVLDKIAEELEEVRHEFEHGADEARLADEIGDVLFVAANLARHAKVDVSRALRGANAKFERRFRAMEAIAANEGRELSSYSLDEQEGLWARVKREGLR